MCEWATAATRLGPFTNLFATLNEGTREPEGIPLGIGKEPARRAGSFDFLSLWGSEIASEALDREWVGQREGDGLKLI